MLIVISFVCQTSSSNAEMNPLTNMVTIHTQPNPDLNDQEITSCLAQSNQTALYTITIGTNTFRSSLVFYDTFKEAEIVLLPETGSSVEKSLLFFIASYEITFLDSTLIQSGAIGQLLSTLQNLNECLYNQAIEYETFKHITPLISVNPNCKIFPTNDVLFEFSIRSKDLLSQIIKKADFDFPKLVLSSVDCTIGTEAEKTNCNTQSQYISGSNFIFSEIKLTIPKSITSQNVYVDCYGVAQNITTTYNFLLIFHLEIQNRIAAEKCSKENKLSFNKQSVFVSQKIDQPCDFVGYPRQEFWITASEFEDNSGGQFQLQFYTDTPFAVNQYVDCDTWEISEYKSRVQCEAALESVSRFPPNMTLSILYKLFDKDDYLGSDRFTAQIIPSGVAELIVSENQLCVTLMKNLTGQRTFANIDIKVSASFQRYQQNEVDFYIDDNFIFPSKDNQYCFNVNDKQERLLNILSFQNVFGIVEVAGSILQINDMRSLLPYDYFYEGFISLGIILGIMLIWIIFKLKLSKKYLHQ